MTNATFKRNNDVFRVLIDGHAGYAPEGEPDIVCSACSSHTYTLLQVVLAEKVAGNLAMYEQDIDESKGHFYIKFRPKPHAAVWFEAYINYAASAFALLQDRYPGYVKLTFKENR